MYIIGLLLYIGVPALAFFLDISREFITQTFELAPEISMLVAGVYVYPLLVFLASMIFKQKSFANVEYFRSQVTLCSTLAVSFGLIGTFIGLANMIARIAEGMGGNSQDFSAKMGDLLTAIGAAMDSMSFAFLTSILGVGASIAILLSSNYLASYYQGAYGGVTGGKSSGRGFGGRSTVNAKNTELDNFARHAQTVETSVQQTLELISDKEKVWSDLHMLLDKSSKSVVVDQLNETLFQNNNLITEMTGVLKVIHDDQLISNEKFQSLLQGYTDKMAGELVKVSNAIHHMSVKIENMDNSVAKSAAATSVVVEQTTKELTGVASVLGDIRLEMAEPIENMLKLAIETNEMTLTYQSINNRIGDIVGVEVFVSWNQSIRGKIPNIELFKIARKEGLSIELDIWVLNTALKQLSAWRVSGLWDDQWVLAINVTEERLLCPNFITDLELSLIDMAIPAKLIALEITDTTIMNNPDACKDKIRQLSNMGLKVYIDDFGTGYSSLMNLQEISIDALKIDRNVIRQLLASDNAGISIIETIMVVAQNMRISVFAEGVERQEDMTKLSRIGCTYFQGYLFSKPMSSSEFEQQYLKDTA